MNLDTTTLTFAGGFVALMASLLLAGAAIQIPRARALGWWASASLLDGLGIFVIALGAGGHPALTVPAITLVTLSPALVWAGARRFAGQTVSVPLVVAGVAFWLVLSLFVSPQRPQIAGALSFIPSVIYLLCSAYELWRGRDEPLRGRFGLIAVLTLHALVLSGGIFDVLAGTVTFASLPRPATWLGLIDFETLFYSMASAVFMVLLTKERSERRYLVASREDFLTGVANRGALLKDGERLLRRCLGEGRSFSVVMFDLDRFKRVNDTFGHAAGDVVLRNFAKIAQAALRPNDLLGRYGGEEFVLMLPGATVEAAYVIAERIRAAFAANPIAAGDSEIRATVSAGVASATSAVLTLEAILTVADAGLYRAKDLGRNRVERPPRQADEVSNTVIRVA